MFIFFHNRTRTSTHGIRNCLLSSMLRNHSHPDPSTLEVFPPALVLMESSTALAIDAPVSFSAENASPAVSDTAARIVLLPPSAEAHACDVVVESPANVHRGSNQSALKSNSVKTRMKRRIEQYTHGRCRAYVAVRKRRT